MRLPSVSFINSQMKHQHTEKRNITVEFHPATECLELTS